MPLERVIEVIRSERRRIGLAAAGTALVIVSTVGIVDGSQTYDFNNQSLKTEAPKFPESVIHRLEFHFSLGTLSLGALSIIQACIGTPNQL